MQRACIGERSARAERSPMATPANGQRPTLSPPAWVQAMQVPLTPQTGFRFTGPAGSGRQCVCNTARQGGLGLLSTPEPARCMARDKADCVPAPASARIGWPGRAGARLGSAPFSPERLKCLRLLGDPVNLQAFRRAAGSGRCGSPGLRLAAGSGPAAAPAVAGNSGRHWRRSAVRLPA